MAERRTYKLVGVNPIHPQPGMIVVPGTPEADKFQASIEPDLESFFFEIGAIEYVTEPIVFDPPKPRRRGASDEE